MSDLVERMRKCSERVSKSKFPDYHAACWLEKGADRIEALEEVALHAKRRLSDPSWGPHKINLTTALLALKDNQENEG